MHKILLIVKIVKNYAHRIKKICSVKIHEIFIKKIM